MPLLDQGLREAAKNPAKVWFIENSLDLQTYLLVVSLVPEYKIAIDTLGS